MTSTIEHLSFIDSLALLPNSSSPPEKWIYKITLNPREVVSSGREIIILFGEDRLSIDGKCYIPEHVSYSEILYAVKSKYDYLLDTYGTMA